MDCVCCGRIRDSRRDSSNCRAGNRRQHVTFQRHLRQPTKRSGLVCAGSDYRTPSAAERAYFSLLDSRICRFSRHTRHVCQHRRAELDAFGAHRWRLSRTCRLRAHQPADHSAVRIAQRDVRPNFLPEEDRPGGQLAAILSYEMWHAALCKRSANFGKVDAARWPRLHHCRSDAAAGICFWIECDGSVAGESRGS